MGCGIGDAAGLVIGGGRPEMLSFMKMPLEGTLGPRQDSQIQI